MNRGYTEYRTFIGSKYRKIIVFSNVAIVVVVVVVVVEYSFDIRCGSKAEAFTLEASFSVQKLSSLERALLL